MVQTWLVCILYIGCLMLKSLHSMIRILHIQCPKTCLACKFSPSQKKIQKLCNQAQTYSALLYWIFNITQWCRISTADFLHIHKQQITEKDTTIELEWLYVKISMNVVSVFGQISNKEANDHNINPLEFLTDFQLHNSQIGRKNFHF